MIVYTVGMPAQVLQYAHEHKHDRWEIILNLQGEGYMLIGDRRYEYTPGTIVFCPPHSPHIKYSKNGFRDVYLHSNVFPLSKLITEKDLPVIQDDTEKSFEALMLLALRTFHKKESNYGALVDSLFESMNQLLISWIQGTPVDKDIEQIKNTLVESFTDPEFTVSRLLENSPYCADHLRRRFKDATGQTPLEYLTQLRLEYAKRLICENRISHYSIAEIGEMSGYYDSHYFSKVFKKYMGVTPTEYLHNVSQT